MRLIDADALPRLTQIYEFNGKQMEKEIVDAKFIDTAPTIDVPQWIPCEERLPENSNTVLITKKSVFGNDNVVCFGWYIGDNHWAIINYKEPDVIAWMPLPEPYKGERKDDD